VAGKIPDTVLPGAGFKPVNVVYTLIHLRKNAVHGIMLLPK
jgi:hypothetical protein